jgi:hypothetical protein
MSSLEADVKVLLKESKGLKSREQKRSRKEIENYQVITQEEDYKTSSSLNKAL